MALPLARRAGFVCKSCQFKQLSTTGIRPLSSIGFAPTSARPPRSRLVLRASRLEKRTAASAIPTLQEHSAPRSSRTLDKGEKKQAAPVEAPPAVLKTLKQQVYNITSAKTLPARGEVVKLLESILQFSNTIVVGHAEQPDADQSVPAKRNPSSSILSDLEEAKPTVANLANTTVPPSALPASFRTKAINTISETAYNLVSDPKVVIDEKTLRVYVRIQCLLSRPQYLPEIFHLYAHKPIPTQIGNSILYKDTTPWLPRYEIPLAVSDAALEAALAVKDMPLAIAITDTTVKTTPRKLMRFLLKGTPPIAAVCTLPFISYAGASWVSTYQNVWDVDTSFWTTMACCGAYIFTVTTTGFIAMTTWNDHMVRVQWVPGTGLLGRWLREDERAYLDRVAQAWGFPERHRRGEEQGEEWEALREVCGLREMVLDKSDLLEGMQ